MRKECEDYIILRKCEGATLQNISDELLEKFDFKTSKQNIHKFYARWCEKEVSRTNDEYIINDVLNVVIRKRFIKDCEGLPILNNISTYKLRRYVKEYKEDLDELKEELDEKILDKYVDGDDISDISHSLGYKGIDVDDDVILRVLKKRIKGFTV